MNTRSAKIEAFLAPTGWATAARQPIGADWSSRRYFRLQRGADRAVLMDAPATPELQRFITIDQWLRDIGLHAPEVLLADAEVGLLLLEDLGLEQLAAAAQRDGLEIELYRLATAVILRFQAADPPAGLPIMDDRALLALLELFPEHAAPGLPATAQAQFRAIWHDLLPATMTGSSPFIHRDYHAQNLMWLPAEQGLWRLGLLDFQDAHIGPSLYDLVSLLQDARRDVSPAAAQAAVTLYRQAHPQIGDSAFAAAMAVLGAQRAMRILGVVARLRREADRQFPDGLEARVRRHLSASLQHPLMAELAHWCARVYDLASLPG